MYQENFMIREAMQEIARNYGVMAFSDANSLMKYYANMAPDRHREQMVLDAFLRREGNLQFYNAARKSREEQTTLYENLVHSICIETALDERLVREVAGAVAQVLWDYDPGSPQGIKLSLFTKRFWQNRTAKTWQNQTKPSRDPGKGLMKNNSLIKREKQENTQSESPKPVRKKNWILWAGLAMVVVGLIFSLTKPREVPQNLLDLCEAKNWSSISVSDDKQPEVFATDDSVEMATIMEYLSEVTLYEDTLGYNSQAEVELYLYDGNYKENNLRNRIRFMKDGTVIISREWNGGWSASEYRTKTDIFEQLSEYLTQKTPEPATFPWIPEGNMVCLADILVDRAWRYARLESDVLRHYWDADSIGKIESQFAQTDITRTSDVVKGTPAVTLSVHDTEEYCLIRLYANGSLEISDGENTAVFTGAESLCGFLEQMAKETLVPEFEEENSAMLKTYVQHFAENSDSMISLHHEGSPLDNGFLYCTKNDLPTEEYEWLLRELEQAEVYPVAVFDLAANCLDILMINSDYGELSLKIYENGCLQICDERGAGNVEDYDFRTFRCRPELYQSIYALMKEYDRN